MTHASACISVARSHAIRIDRGRDACNASGELNPGITCRFASMNRDSATFTYCNAFWCVLYSRCGQRRSVRASPVTQRVRYLSSRFSHCMIARAASVDGAAHQPQGRSVAPPGIRARTRLRSGEMDGAPCAPRSGWFSRLRESGVMSASIGSAMASPGAARCVPRS